MSDQAYINNSIKELVQINKNFEIKYDQYCENIEATQRFISEKVGGIRSLVELNHTEIIKNRHEILENRTLILNRIDLMREKLDKIDLLDEKINLLNKNVNNILKHLNP